MIFATIDVDNDIYLCDYPNVLEHRQHPCYLTYDNHYIIIYKEYKTQHMQYF